MTQTLSANIPQGVQIASAATAKKPKKTAAAVLAEIFSQIPQRGKAAGKTGMSFKNILEPAKSGTLKNTAEPNENKTNKQKKSEKKNSENSNSANNMIIPSGEKKIEVNGKICPGQVINNIKNSQVKAENGIEMSLTKAGQMKTVIKPHLPMHDKTPGKNDSAGTLTHDAKLNIDNANNNSEHRRTEGAEFLKSEKVSRLPAELKIASEKMQISSTVKNAQMGLAASVPLSQETSSPVLESKAKAPSTRVPVIGREKIQAKYESFNRENTGNNFKEKQAKSLRPDAEPARKMQILESSSVSTDTTGRPEYKIATAEQFASPNRSSTSISNSHGIVNFKNPASIYDQVSSAAVTASYKIGQRVSINLNPPELGRINIKFEKIGDEVIGRVEIEKIQTKNQVDINISQLVQNLQDAGVPLKQLEVVLREQPFETQKEFAGNAQPDWNEKQQFTPDKNDSDITSPIIGNDHTAYSDIKENYYDEKSVNLLI